MDLYRNIQRYAFHFRPMALFLNVFVYLIAIVSGSSDELEAEFGPYRDHPDRELMLDFYKRLASIDLQDVKRGQFGDLEYGEDSFPSAYRSENIYGEGADGFGEPESESDDVEQFISDKSAAIRDPELTQHSSNLGILQMTESEKQQTKPGSVSESLKTIKSDDPLPFYCHPPNPCPKGYSSKDNCQEFIEDTAEYQKEWIQQMQRKGICSCDEEHMFDCSSEAESLITSSKEDMDKFFINFVKEKEQENPFTQRGQKRISLVAKKSPRIKRDDKYALMDKEMDKMTKDVSDNPYLAGKRLPTIAKKGFVDVNG